MPTISATAFPGEAYVLVQADWSAAPTADYAHVTRRNTVTGETVNLRPYTAYDDTGALLLDCGLGLWWDTEPPLNVPLEYCTIASQATTTVSQNSTFESTTAPWTVSSGTLTQDCTVAKSGSCSARLSPSGVDASPAFQQDNIALVAGVETTASAWVRSGFGWNGVRLSLTIDYADNTIETVSSPIEILDDNEWRYLSVTITPRTTVDKALFAITALGTPTGANLFNLDEAKVVQATTLTATACATVTVASESMWLKNPQYPCRDVEIGICNPMLADCDEPSRVSYVGVDVDSYAPNTVLLAPANRRRPIPQSRVRRGPAGILRLLAHDCQARDAVLDANEPGNELLFQALPDYCLPDRYLSIGNVDEIHLSVDQREDFRLMVLPYVTVDRPPGPANGVCGARIMDLCDIYTSWAAFVLVGLTWNDLLLGEASPSGPGQPEPPAATRTWGAVEAEFANWLAVEAGGARDWGELRDGL